MLREISLRLRSHCTIFCKRVNARAEIRHTDLLECSDCKIFACRKKLAQARKLVGYQADYLHARASFISEAESDLLYMGSKGNINLNGKMQTKARLRKQMHARKNKLLM